MKHVLSTLAVMMMVVPAFANEPATTAAPHTPEATAPAAPKATEAMAPAKAKKCHKGEDKKACAERQKAEATVTK